MAILYGTQSNGETLPVLVDQFGNLLAKGIDGARGPAGDQGEQGDQGIPGNPGAPGQGVPLPYGEDGSYLQIVNGAPEWIGETPPEPPGPIPGNVELKDIFTYYQAQNETGSSVQPPDGMEWLVNQSSWKPTASNTLNGAVFPLYEEDITTKPKDRYQLTNSFGNVLTVRYEIQYQQDQVYTREKWVFRTDSPYVQIIENTFPKFPDNVSGTAWNGGNISFLCNAEVPEIEIEIQGDRTFMKNKFWFVRWFALEDPGTFALNQQIRLKEEVRALREVVMSSNQQSQS